MRKKIYSDISKNIRMFSKTLCVSSFRAKPRASCFARRLGFAGGAKLTCKHVSLACTFRVNKNKQMHSLMLASIFLPFLFTFKAKLVNALRFLISRFAQNKNKQMHSLMLASIVHLLIFALL